MERKRIGRSELKIAPLVLGCNMLGWTVDRDTAFAILDRFVAAGFNAIDTADVYSVWVSGHRGGESEATIGEWLADRGQRDRVVLQTKVGAPMGEDRKGLSAGHIVRSVEESLARLRTDYIDLYQSHRDDADVPFEETLEAFDRLIRAGKVRAIGASHFGAERLAAVLQASSDKGLARYDSLQQRFNLYDRVDYGADLQKACVGNEVGVLCYSTLAKGFLTGRYRPGHQGAGDTWKDMVEQRYINDRGERVIAALEQVAEEQDATLAEVALAWVAAQPGVVAPIVGVERVEQLDDFLDYPRLTLEGAQVRSLTDAAR